MDGVSTHREGAPAKVVLWAGSFEPAGTQRFLVELLRRIDRGKFTPIVFSTLAEGELLPEVKALGVPVHEFGTGRHVISPRTFRDMSAAAAFLRREKVDILSCMLGLTTLVGPFSSNIFILSVYFRRYHDLVRHCFDVPGTRHI